MDGMTGGLGELALELTQELLPRRVFLARAVSKLLGADEKLHALIEDVRAKLLWFKSDKFRDAGAGRVIDHARDLAAAVSRLESASLTLLAAFVKRGPEATGAEI